MSLTFKRLAFFLAAALLCAPAARALIIYGTGPADVNNALNTTAPANGAPWANVVQFGVNNASGVYLGNGFILTANHVTVVDSGIVINGVSYDRDPSFAPLQISEAPDSVDLKLVKIIGLPPLPVVQSLPLNFSTSSDLNANCTLIGWGVGKGAIIANQGWYWGDDSTHAERWGTNHTLSSAVAATYSGYSYEALETPFSRSCQITLGDSGSGLFQKLGTVWKLSGLTTTVLRYLDGAAQYDGVPTDPLDPTTFGDQPDAANFVRIAKYAHLLRYENWANLKLGSATADATADADKDSSSNLLEYAFHTNPNSASASSLPQLGLEPGFVTLTYTKLLSATDLSYVVEQSPDASTGSWTPATVTGETVATSGLTATIKAKVAVTTEPKKFLRLSVTRLP